MIVTAHLWCTTEPARPSNASTYSRQVTPRSLNLQRLVAILGTISKNPSNLNFDQYIFESISALMRCVRFCSKPSIVSASSFPLLVSSFMFHPRIHSIRVSNTSSNAVVAQHRRPDEYRALLPLLPPLAGNNRGASQVS